MERIIVYTQPASPVAEAYRVLCTNVLACLEGKKLIEVAAVTVDTEEEASLMVSNLAVGLAQAGKQVLLLDCNLRNPQLHELFGKSNKGIIEYLNSTNNFGDFVQQTGQHNLYLLAAGATILNPVEKLLSDAMENLIMEVKEAYDIVLMFVPAVVGVADAAAIGAKTDGVLLSITNKLDKVEQVNKAKEIFTQAGVSILGCVLEKV